MKKQLPEPKNEIAEDKDPAEIMGLYDIARAKTIEELRIAVAKSITSLDNYSEVDKYITYQESVKNFLNGSRDQALAEQVTKDFDEIIKRTAIETGKYVRTSVHSIDQSYILKLREQLVSEYKASSTSEMLIVDMAVNAYFRSLRASVIHINLIQNKDGVLLTPEQTRTNLLKELGKQIEMANRQFMTAITFLKELRQPPINVKVHAKEAFVGQNQQFNKNA